MKVRNVGLKEISQVRAIKIRIASQVQHDLERISFQ